MANPLIGKAALSLFLLATVGCSSPLLRYEGKTPDLTLTGVPAQEEIRRFRLEEKECGFPCFESDPKKREHTWESVRPMLEAVSPEAMAQYHKAEVWQNVQLYSLGVGIAGLALGLASQEENPRQTFFSLSVAGSVISILSPLFVGVMQAGIPKIYNQDLQKRLSPAVGVYFQSSL